MSLPIILAIETSQRAGGVALRDASGVVHVEMLRESKRHDDDLMPAIERVVTRAGLLPRDLEAVGISIGPGGFTGLRIAISTGKMLSETVGAKLAGVPSALVAAESCSETFRGPLLVALASKGETCWLTRLEREGDHWKIAGEPGLTDAQSLDLTDCATLLGDAYLPEAIRERCDVARVQIISPIFDPAACLKVASSLICLGENTDPLVLSPLYPRPPEAVTLWKKRLKTSPEVQ